ncbi:MAG: TOBE domain-containing protein, partial [Rhodococcus sp. (in: high G+C Gram-positive bacteria)]
DGVATELGNFELPRERRAAIQKKNPGNEVVVGIRPEHFEDAALIDSYQKLSGATFTAKVDVMESMGSDKYVYFESKGNKVQSAELQELAADAGLGEAGAQVVARLAAESKAAAGSDVELWFDPAKISVFDQASGDNLTL